MTRLADNLLPLNEIPRAGGGDGREGDLATNTAFSFGVDMGVWPHTLQCVSCCMSCEDRTWSG